MSIINHSYHLLAEILPVFFIAILASSLIDKFLPQNFITRISSSKYLFFTVLNSSIIGALIPLCTCGMIPLTVKLHQKQLHWKALVAFLVAGNACSIPALILTAKLSWDLALLRLVASVGFGVVCAYLLGFVVGKDYKLNLHSDKTEVHEEHNCCDHEHKKNLLQVVLEDLSQMVKEFLGWIILAVLLAASFDHFFGANEIVRSVLSDPDYNLLSPVIASVIGFPFYFCAGADIPLSSEFLKLGLGAGSVISFMLASPGANLTSLLVYHKAIGWKSSWVLILVSMISASLIGIIINLRLW